MAERHADRFIEALRALEEDDNLDDMVSLYADGAELRNPTDDAGHRGPEGARRFWDAYRHTFDEIHSEFHSVAEGDGVAMLEWTSRGRMAGGEEIEYDGVSVVEFDGDRIRRFRAYFDPLALGEQVERAAE